MSSDARTVLSGKKSFITKDGNNFNEEDDESTKQGRRFPV